MKPGEEQGSTEMPKRENLPVRKQQSLAGEIDNLNHRIMRRAFEIFQSRGSMIGSELDDWLTAEKEFSLSTSIEMSEKDNEILLNVAMPDVDPKDIQIETTEEDLVVKAESHQDGESHSMLRTVHFPRKINPDKMKAEFKDGKLTIRAPLAKEQGKRDISIEAA
jgi:HSP20 family protein